MKIIVIGGEGLLAHALSQLAPAPDEFVFLRHAEFDLTQPALMAARLEQLRPDVVINTAAYNLVDRCEIERELSWAVNATGPQQLAELCARAGIRLVHYGTDYVFDGEKKSPYHETDAVNPLNHYAAGKYAGEQAVLRASANHLVLRTSWIFGSHPTQKKTFVHTVLRAACEGRALKATTDQTSVPTFAPDLAEATLALVRLGASGLFHAVNDEGVSRFDWTNIILAEAVQAKLIAAAPRVEPVLSSFFSPTMKRADYTVMSNEKMATLIRRAIGSWRHGLKKMLAHESGG
jgi:dTDP-4-dehydrorhamnose reductase